jgi:signal transduction histidine kinase
VPVELDISVGRLAPAVEAAMYFVCSEALANTAKHARATRMTIGVSQSSGHVFVALADDGVGGADLGSGSGLRGLADRVEALGGQLSIRSPMGGGTRLDATFPVDMQQ